MAFSPVHHFRKYQKFWMATVLLLCMVTFVLCTGSKGDLSDNILGMFRSGRSGAHVATIHGVKLYQSEMEELKKQRVMANEFMQKYSELARKGLRERMKELANDKERKDLVPRLKAAEQDLSERKFKKWFFDTGSKLDELVDFRLWLDQADRLNINLLTSDVISMIDQEVFAYVAFPGYAPRERHTAYLAMAHGPERNETAVINSVRNEFRVRIAQLAVEKAQIEAMMRGQRDLGFKFTTRQDVRAVPTPAELWDIYRSRVAPTEMMIVPVRAEDFLRELPAIGWKGVPTPPENELNVFFQDSKKKAYDPASPEFGAKAPSQVMVEWVSADPRSPLFKRMSKAAVAFEATGLPNPLGSPVFAAVTYGLNDLAWRERLHDIYINQIVHAGGRTGREETQYSAAPLLSEFYYVPIATYLTAKHPESGAILIGEGAAAIGIGNLNLSSLGLVGLAESRHPREWAKGLADETADRLPLFATLAANGPAGSAYVAIGQASYLSKSERFLAPPQSAEEEAKMPSVRERLKKYFRHLPLDVVSEEMAGILERRLAEKWVSSTMQELQKKLDRQKVQGNKKAIDSFLDDYVMQDHILFVPALPNQPSALAVFVVKDVKKGVERGSTHQYYTRFDIDKAPELEPLRKAYEKYWSQINIFEGRDITPELRLKEGDFYKLFFDGGEPFSAANARYKVKPWPPEVRPNNLGLIEKKLGEDRDEIVAKVAEDLRKQQDAAKDLPPVKLFDKAERPFLFWKTDDLPEKIPDKLDDDGVRKLVENAWKIQSARGTSLQHAKKIADEYQKSGNTHVLELEAKKLDQDPFKLSGVAAMVPSKNRLDYHPYALEKAKFLYPRDDTAANLVKMGNLKEPILTGESLDKDLDEINKVLFKTAEENKDLQNKLFVQIIPNKPRTIYYVVVLDNKDASIRAFKDRYALGAAGADAYLLKAQEEFAREARQMILQQMRGTDYWLLEGDERKRFDSNEGL